MKYLLASLSVFTILTLVFVSCSPKPNYTVAKFDLASNFDLPIGKAAKLNNGDLQVTFNAVSEDSRCPAGTNCLRAGTVTANITIGNADGKETFNFKLGEKASKPETKKFKGYSINLMQVNPYPQTGEKINKQDYVAQLRVVK